MRWLIQEKKTLVVISHKKFSSKDNQSEKPYQALVAPEKRGWWYLVLIQDKKKKNLQKTVHSIKNKVYVWFMRGEELFFFSFFFF